MPAGWTGRLRAAPALPMPWPELQAPPFPVSITGLAAGVSPRREAAALILLKAHHGLCSLVLYLFIYLKSLSTMPASYVSPPYFPH